MKLFKEKFKKIKIVDISILYFFIMKNLILKTLGSLQAWVTRFWPQEKIISILDWFDVDTTKDITENDLDRILRYNFLQIRQSFFIIWWTKNSPLEHRFSPEDIEKCYGANWYALIRPGDSSHIVIPSEAMWIQFDAKWNYHISSSDGRLWERWWWAFQLDKNINKPVCYSSLNSEQILSLSNDILQIS